MQKDPRLPIVYGMIGLGILMIGGMIWAVLSAPDSGSRGQYDANVSFNDAEDPVWGDEDAPVTIRIFEDFECPACATAKRGLDHVKATYGDQVRLIWNDLPLDSIHPNARRAANAARCAEEQGAFWEYHDLLYENQRNWAQASRPDEQFLQLAQSLDLNAAAFQRCTDEARYNHKIQADVREALANRVNSAPTFFIGKDRFTGALTAQDWDRELRRRLNVTEHASEPVVGENAGVMEDSAQLEEATTPVPRFDTNLES
ncbi:thioredoxin domain-containing protein, partial [Candidatus Uhrbacteria bacterium]|nr:thioredoxin domain-containing protein [Candidatus Uhrbacteria bacterium]